MYSCLLNNTKIRGTDPYAVKSEYNIWLPHNLVVSWYLLGVGSSVSSLSVDSQLQIETVQVFIGKKKSYVYMDLCKPLFKGQVYIH